MDRYWLPEGLHWGLHIEHHPLTGAGAFTGGGDKLTWHTTESDRDSYLAIKELFIDRDRMGLGSEPTLMIGYKPKAKYPFVCQFLPFNRAARALRHPAGTPETNRCNNTQIEICERAANSGEWSESYYKALANLAVLIEHRRSIPRICPRAFSDDKRWTSGQWVALRGHTGHKHAPFQDHTDPGDGFKGSHLLSLMADAPHKL